MNFINKIRSYFITITLTAGIVSLINGIIPDNRFLPATSANESHIIFENLNHAASGDKFAEIYLLIFFILAGAVLGRFIAKKVKQPAVLGELIVGVIIGVVLYQFNSPIITLIRNQDEVNKIVENNLSEHITWRESVEKNVPRDSDGDNLSILLQSEEFPSYNLTVQAIFLLSNLGVLLLLFVVGLQSSMEEMASFGGAAMSTALIGIIAPSLLGYFVAKTLLPDHDPNFYLFVGATLCATSIGITARVLKDMNRLNLPESKIILGAAVIDDILGLIILAVVAGIISSGSIEVSTVVIILLKAILFLGTIMFIGKKYLGKQIKIYVVLDHKNARLLFPFALLMLMAWLSDMIGLASIVGAFAAGLIIKEEYFNDALNNSHKSVKDVIEPIEAIFAPVFFVIMGLQVDITSFADLNILGTALILTLVAIFGKLISGIFAKGMNKTIIGIGMVPRGEVGLIFASIGKGLGILDSSLFSGIVIIVILTTFVTPPALKWAFEKHDKKN